MIYYSKIVKIKMDYITKYQYVKLIHFLRRHHSIIFLVHNARANRCLFAERGTSGANKHPCSAICYVNSTIFC